MRKFNLRLESLADRSLPSASLAGGILTVTGTDAADRIEVRQHGDTITVRGMTIDVGGVSQKSVSAQDVTEVVVDGLGGNDRINLRTLKVPTSVDGGAGNDLIVGGMADDSITGGDGNDSLFGEAGDDSLTGGAGNDVEHGGRGTDMEAGDAGDDRLFGEAGDDSLMGGDGNDSEHGGTGNDDLNGDAGDDRLFGEAGDDSVQGGTGNDHASGEAGDDSVHGGLGDDTCNGGMGTDDVSGDMGDDTSHGGESHGDDADFRTVLTDAAGHAVGVAEVEVGDGGAEFQAEVHGAAANTTFDVVLDVAGDGSNLVTVGQLTTNAEGEGSVDLHDVTGLPAIQSGVTVLHLNPTGGDASLALSGTLSADAAIGSKLEAKLAAPSGSAQGSAEFDPAPGQFEVKVEGAAANTQYAVYVNGDAATGTLVGHATADSRGRVRFEVLTDATFPALAAGSVITVASADSQTLVQGTLAAGGDDN
jgi:hypothetical protein